MKFVLGTTLLSLFVTKCTAQSTFVRIPAPGDTLIAGQNFTVQLVRPVSLIYRFPKCQFSHPRQISIEGSTEVGVAIGILNCPTSPCAPPDAQMGRILYTGSYNPQLHEIPGEFYQNFSLYLPTIAQGDNTGNASVQIARLHLIGVCRVFLKSNTFLTLL